MIESQKSKIIEPLEVVNVISYKLRFLCSFQSLFTAVCNKKGISKMRAIKWLLQSINFSDLCH